MRSICRGPLLGVIAAAAAAALALAVPAVARAGGDPAAGQRKSTTCAACHVAPDPATDAPHLVGQRASYLAVQLEAFRARDRSNPLMNAIAHQLSDDDIADLAAFWSAQPDGSDAHLPPAAAAIRQSRMAFPKDFPRGFTLYLTSNDAARAAVKQIYINAPGLEAARHGKPLPDGTIVMVVNCAAKLGPDHQPILDKDGAWAVDRITSYAGMEARAGWGDDLPEWLRNAHWSYRAFTADRAPDPGSNQAACLACHKPQAVVSYVFTFNELWDAARTK